MSRSLLLRTLLAVVVGLSTFALADEREVIFARFDHAEHEKALARSAVSCLVCHQVGARQPGLDDAQLGAWLEPPRAACHECHAPGAGGLGAGVAAVRAPRACDTCHAQVPVPESHVAGWVAHHGADARAPSADCRDCHERSTCVDCHDRREDTTFDVHDAAWLSVHGVAARANPASCDSCHVKAECTSCHDSAAGFGRAP